MRIGAKTYLSPKCTAICRILIAVMRFRGVLTVLFLCLPSWGAGEELDAQLRRIFSSPAFAAKRFGPARWIENGAAYSTVEAGSIIRYDTVSGKRSVLVDAKALTPPSGKPLALDDYEWSDDDKKLLVFTNTRKVWRNNTRGDYWVLDLASKRLTQVAPSATAATLMFAKFSPDATRVAYVRENNIYVETLATQATVALTTDGSATLINGTTDWVYEEELSLSDAFRWSPDGTRIAYWQFDSTGVGSFTLLNNTATTYPVPTVIPYPKAGTTNSAVRVGVIPAAGGQTRWIDVPGDSRNHYIAAMEWRKDALEIQQLNRKQNTLILFRGDASNGTVREVFRDTDEAWVDTPDFGAEPPLLNGGKDFLWLSERDGWRRAYAVPVAGGTPVPLTPEGMDVIAFEGLDANNQWLYFIASPNKATMRFLYRAPVNRSAGASRVTPGELNGTHSYRMSPDGRFALHVESHFDRPPVTDLISLPDHKRIRLLEGNEPLRAAAASAIQPSAEFFEVVIDGGVTIDGWMLRPRNFDATKKYPVIVHVYGEPASVTVTDAWPGARGLFHRALANEGYLVVSFDNRGTPAPKGRAWRKSIYGSVGMLSTQDQAEALTALARQRSYVDITRAGVWGWSGGGSNTLNMMFRAPDLYKVGVSVAPVPDQRLYDTIYQERYMGLPDENAAGYRVGSSIHHAEGLRGKLLLVHGTGDDNVHYQGAERLVNRLIELGKPFDFMAYPNRTHSINEGTGTSYHLYALIARYFLTNLPAGPLQ